MIGADEATAIAERLAAPWPICRVCGDPHLPEHPCNAVDAPTKSRRMSYPMPSSPKETAQGGGLAVELLGAVPVSCQPGGRDDLPGTNPKLVPGA
jgi:hypothetical protein